MSGLRNTVTFVVTEECNLRCSYCYMRHKNNRARMSLDTAKRAIDHVLARRDVYDQPGVSWDFIGGEPFLEIDLIEQIAEYALRRSYELEHPWFIDYVFNFSTNGVLYQTPKVQRFLARFWNHVSVGVTIDGPEIVHDACRRFPDGSGSHAIVERAAKLWMQQFKHQDIHPKVTFGHETLPLIKTSILYLLDLGFKRISCNLVFENVWRPGDVELFEAQLDELGDALIARGATESCRFFERGVGQPVREDKNWCGAGKYMVAVDARGHFYPCVRFMQFALTKQPALTVGSLATGLDDAKLEPFRNLTRTEQGPQKCLTCEVASGCAWCSGFNYDDTGSFARRSTYLCEFHKARVRANARFWRKVDGGTP